MPTSNAHVSSSQVVAYPSISVLTVVEPQTKHSPIKIPVKLASHSAKNGESMLISGLAISPTQTTMS